MLLSLVATAAAHVTHAPHVHPESSPVGLLVVGAWVLLAVAWGWRAAAR